MLDIQIYQIYYNDETKGLLDVSFIPYYNPSIDNYFENSVILDIYNRGINCDFIGVTSPRFKEKTKLKGRQLIKIVNSYRQMDAIIYSPKFYNSDVDILKVYRNPEKNNIYKVLEVLNDKKYLPFDLFEKKWKHCFCNYWVAKSNVFNDYVSKVLKPTIEVMNSSEFKKEISSFNTYKHRDGEVAVETFALECLFGLYLSNNNYNTYNFFFDRRHRHGLWL